MNSNFEWSVVIFAARETSSVLMSGIEHAVRASSRPCAIDILINGNAQLATEMAQRFDWRAGGGNFARCRLWSLAVADKANAWNKYLRFIWPGSKVAFFADGYVRVNSNAFELLSNALDADPGFLGASGVPTQGRTAKSLREHLLAEGGFHGNLCCMRGEVVESITKRDIRLPLGLYRTDSTMGAFLSLNLDPANNEWDSSRIFVHPEASWTLDEKKWWSVGDVLSQLKRVKRQAQGALENQAIRDHLHLKRRRPEDLPETVVALILDWITRNPEAYRKARQWNPLVDLVLSDIRIPRDWGAYTLVPEQLG
jgi:hypothetical protein